MSCHVNWIELNLRAQAFMTLCCTASFAVERAYDEDCEGRRILECASKEDEG